MCTFAECCRHLLMKLQEKKCHVLRRECSSSWKNWSVAIIYLAYAFRNKKTWRRHYTGKIMNVNTLNLKHIKIYDFSSLTHSMCMLLVGYTSTKIEKNICIHFPSVEICRLSASKDETHKTTSKGNAIMFFSGEFYRRQTAFLPVLLLFCCICDPSPVCFKIRFFFRLSLRLVCAWDEAPEWFVYGDE